MSGIVAPFIPLLELPFNFLRVPVIKIRFPRISQPGPMVVFAFVFFSYFLVLSGIIYDVIVEPPSIGSTQDENGAVKPLAFLQYRVNGQFIIEGLSAGMLFAVGGLGFILLDWANAKNTETRNRYLLLLSGMLSLLVAYNLCLVFLRMKIPGYMVSSS